jgi:arsenate reductase (glutaredoxin)
MSYTLYGIANCDKVKAARNWLSAQGIDYRFHDLRADGLSADLLRQWQARLGLDALLNKRSTTWRQLNAQQQTADTDGLFELILQQPTLLKRPLLACESELRVGFSPEQYSDLL